MYIRCEPPSLLTNTKHPTPKHQIASTKQVLTQGHNNINVALPVPANAQPGPDGVYVIAFFNPQGKVCSSLCWEKGVVCVWGGLDRPPNHSVNGTTQPTNRIKHNTNIPHRAMTTRWRRIASTRSSSATAGTTRCVYVDGDRERGLCACSWNDQVRVCR